MRNTLLALALCVAAVPVPGSAQARCLAVTHAFVPASASTGAHHLVKLRNDCRTTQRAVVAIRSSAGGETKTQTRDVYGLTTEILHIPGEAGAVSIASVKPMIKGDLAAIMNARAMRDKAVRR